MPILEPIEEKDLDLESKFKAGKAEAHFSEKEKPELKIEEKKPPEIVSGEKEETYEKILSKVQSHGAESHKGETIKNDAKNFMQKTDAESQIQHLVDVAMEKGVVYAVKVAKHLEDNYVLDMFHDKLLADELHDALLKKGLIKEL